MRPGSTGDALLEGGTLKRSTPEPVQWPLRPARRHQLRASPPSIIGRERDCELARASIIDEQVRLLTFVGPPGVGKTRLALAVAESVEDQFEHGAAFVDLAPLSDAGLVLEAIARAFGLREQAVLSAADQLEAYLRDMSVLLVLDNFEHLLEASTDVTNLLAYCPGLVVLGTSRMPLRVRWERVQEVHPLDAQASVAVFVDRARAVRGSFDGDADIPVLEEICARLDGLPLAIELAAARCVVLSPAEMLRRLSRRLVLLTDAPRDASARHRTLRNAIDWSYELLSPDERTLLRRLSVFVGSFTLESADAVFADTNAGSFECLTALVRMSLVRLEPQTGAESRFRLLEVIREYAWERLVAEGEADDAQLQHAEFLRNFVEAHYGENFSSTQPELADRIQRDYADLRQALTWSLQRGNSEIALRLGGGLHWFWYARGYLAEGLRWLEQALAQSAAASALAQAVAHRAAGAILLNQGSFKEALAHLDSAVTLGRQAEDIPRSEFAMALGVRGVAEIAAGRYAAAEASLNESLEVFESQSDEWGIATAWEVLGAVAALRGEADSAEALATDALRVHRQLGSRENIARALDVLGYAAALRGDYPKANSSFEESLALRRAVTNRPATAAVLARLGLVAYFERKWDRAVSYYRESLALAEEVGDQAALVRCLGQVAALALACGLDRASIARLGVAVRHHKAALGLPSPPVEQIAAKRLEAALRADISTVNLARAWLGGRVMSLDQAVGLGTRLLDQVGVAMPSATGVDPLTRREREVAILIAHGMTNRQIAEELVVAQRTVDTHVERMLAKLGFGTRAQVAAWVATQGLLTAADQDT
jgi:non-specific serine/threonine protein kinase